MPRRHYTIYDNPSDVRVMDMRGRRPNPSFDIYADEWQLIEPMLVEDLYDPAIEGLQQYAEHLDSVLGDLWPPLDAPQLTIVTAFLADMGGYILAQDVEGAALALGNAVDGSVGILSGAGLALAIEDRSKEWKRHAARVVSRYLVGLLVSQERMVVTALREQGALPLDAEDLPDEDIDVSEALHHWFGEALKAGGGLSVASVGAY